jgi:hypothetical protein
MLAERTMKIMRRRKKKKNTEGVCASNAISEVINTVLVTY